MRYEWGGRDKTIWRLFWGLGLIGLGIVFMLEFTGMVPWLSEVQWWPCIVIGMGVAQAATGWSAKRLAGGVSLALIGGWLLVSANDWYGLHWGNSWPLALVAAGTGMIVRALVTPLYRKHGVEEVNVHVLD